MKPHDVQVTTEEPCGLEEGKRLQGGKPNQLRPS